MTTYEVTVTNKEPLFFEGVTIRKAMLANGDYIDIKAFAADPNDSKRQYLLSVKAHAVLMLEGEMSLTIRGFRQLVI